ncbi:MAG TPA: hypothetical protein VGN78_14295 [Solirubrobacteraceae bacterium]|nr:hypothetical protein [Solirubrobacteraceae bacterium]
MRSRAGIAVAAIAVLASGSASVAATAPRVVSLRPDRPAFWTGPTVSSGKVQDKSLCGVTGPCFSYLLRLRGVGARLRVAIDTPSREDTFAFDVIDPYGKVVASASNSNQFNAEAFVAKPTPGLWRVEVRPQDVTDASFRMRAKLEKKIPATATGHVALLPDLRAVPPMEFTFIAPLNPLNGLYPPDTVNPPMDVAGVHPLTCTVDETAPATVGGGASTKCLRFTSGPIDVGVGPFEMHFRYAADVVGGVMLPIGHGPISQTIHYGDGSTSTRPAGTYSYHFTHAHFHDDNILYYELFKVSGRSLVKAGEGTKSGFCPANQLFGEWRRFVQAPPDGFIGSGDTGTGNCQNPVDGVLGLSPGWGDVYRWQRPGQYVEFGSNGDGRYVVRSTVDHLNHVLESNDSNNSAYALINVVGDHVQLLERGWGTGPFDPRKVVFRGAGPASQD